jgi:hypothetical protein
MMEAVRTSETSVDNHFTRQYNPEDNSEHHTRRRENLKSHKNPKVHHRIHNSSPPNDYHKIFSWGVLLGHKYLLHNYRKFSGLGYEVDTPYQIFSQSISNWTYCEDISEIMDHNMAVHDLAAGCTFVQYPCYSVVGWSTFAVDICSETSCARNFPRKATYWHTKCSSKSVLLSWHGVEATELSHRIGNFLAAKINFHGSISEMSHLRRKVSSWKSVIVSWKQSHVYRSSSN